LEILGQNQICILYFLLPPPVPIQKTFPRNCLSGSGATNHFQRMGVRRNSAETHQTGYAQRSGQRSKWRWVRPCRWCPQVLQEEFSFRYILH